MPIYPGCCCGPGGIPIPPPGGGCCECPVTPNSWILQLPPIGHPCEHYHDPFFMGRYRIIRYDACYWIGFAASITIFLRCLDSTWGEEAGLWNVGISGSFGAPGSVVHHRAGFLSRRGEWNCLGENTLYKVGDTGQCPGFPDTITLIPE